MAKSRRRNRKKKSNSSKICSDKSTKFKKNTSGKCSETSSFKGFNENLISQSVTGVEGNNSLEKDSSGEDKDEVFDKLLNDGFKHHFNKNIKTYYNKKKEETYTNTVLEFNDNRNRDDIIKWLNDNRNVFNRLTQTQNENISQECESQFDLPSVSQRPRLNRSKTQPSRYKLRARSLDIEVKKSICSGRNKRYSSVGDSPDFGNYNIEEVNTDEDLPVSVSVKKEAMDIIDLIEDEYLDNIEREIMQREEKMLSGWERIKDFNKSIMIKKPKQLKVKVEESPKKDLLNNNNNRTYDYDVLENYFIENMQKLIGNENDEKSCSVDIVSLKSTLQVGRKFLTMLRKVKEIDDYHLNEFQYLLKELKYVFGNRTNDFGVQTDLEKSHKSVQVMSSFTNAQVQTVPNLIQTDEIKIHKNVQTIIEDKISVGQQTEEIFNMRNDDHVFDDDLDFDFDSEQLLKQKNEVEEFTCSKGRKRRMLETPESINKTNKRPCSDFINNDLSIVFSSCVENGKKDKIEESENSLCSEYVNKNLHKSDLKEKISRKSKTQKQIEELENMIYKAVEPNSTLRCKNELDDNIEFFHEFTEGENNCNLFTSIEVIDGRKTPTKENIRRSLFESKQEDVFSNSIFNSDKTILEKNSNKITILENVVLKAGIDKKNDLSEDDVVDSTPQKSLVYSRDESQLDVTLPPPLEFQDNENNNVLPTSRRPLAVINKITSTPISQKPESEKFLTLSPISWCNDSQKKKKNPNVETKKSSAVYEISKFSPLTIIKNSQDRLSSNSKQKTILNYIRFSQENDFQISQQSFEYNQNKPCIACSRIPKDQVIAISSLTNKKLATYTASFTSKVTHLIVSVNEKNCLKDHTIKFITAVASGIWILNFNWIQECLKKNALVSEEPFEVFDVSNKPGPRNSRLLRDKKPLLKGYTIYSAPPFASTTQQEIENVIRLLGGKVAPSPEYLLDKHGNICIIITEARATQDFELYETWLCALKVVTVDIEWLSRSVGQYQLLSLRPFTLCSDDSLESLGYPRELTANVTYSFSQQTFSTVPSLTEI